MRAPGLDRRDFLRLSVGGSGGLLLAFTLPDAIGRLVAGEPVARRFSAFVALDEEGRVTVTIPVPEIGQGVRTSLAMLVAEELDVGWESVSVVQADAADDLGPHPSAGGSYSVRAYWLPMREAGATVRAALVGAAAARWRVPAAECRTGEGRVTGPGGEQAAYGDLAATAAARPLPEDVRLKDARSFRMIGTDQPNVDGQAIVRGAATFGLDAAAAGTPRAVVARCPTYGGTVRGFDGSAALRVPGVRAVRKIDSVGGTPERPYAVEGVAVVADSTWAAIQGRKALVVEWDEGPNVGESTERLHAVCGELVSRPAEPFRAEGDVDEALASADRVVEAVYHAPFLAHAPLEPMNCVVHVRPDGCEIHAPTQIPVPLWRNAAALLDLSPEQVNVHVTRVGGGFGRRLGLEYALEAIQVAREADGPVQLVWTREDDMRHGFFRPFSYHRLWAGLDARGGVTGWLHRQAGTSRYAFRDGEEPGRSEFREGTYPAALTPAFRLEYALAPSNLPVGPLRAPGLNAYTFAVESFLDEVARAAGRDPLELRLDLLAEGRELAWGGGDVLDTGRLRRVLEVVAEAAGWGRPRPAGRGLGMAAMSTFGSYAAEVAEVSVDEGSGRVTVHRVTGAIDCGRVVHPQGVRAQMEGGMLDALGAALHGEITITGGRVDQSNFSDYPLLRYGEAPAVDVRLVESDAPPSGAGEPPYPPMFAALANAVADACGARVRNLPLRPARVLAALGRGTPTPPA